MTKYRTWWMGALSILVAIAAVWMARSYLNHTLSKARNGAGGIESVVVARVDIPFATRIGSEHIRRVSLPTDATAVAHFTKEEDVLGLIASQRVYAGEILARSRFVDRESGSILAALVPSDARAVTVRVDDVVGVAGFLLPGNHVDVVASRLLPDRRAEAETILQNLVVLAVDQTSAQDKDQPVVVRAVTIQVTPEQAERLVKAREEGRIQLTLRSPADDLQPSTITTAEHRMASAPPPTPAADLAALLRDGAVPARRPRALAPPPSGAVDVLRGTYRQTEVPMEGTVRP